MDRNATCPDELECTVTTDNQGEDWYPSGGRGVSGHVRRNEGGTRVGPNDVSEM